MDKVIRCHFSSIITKTLKVVWFLIVLVLFNLPDEIVKMQQEGYKLSYVLIAMCVFLGVIFIVFLYNFLHWRKTYIYIEDDNFVVDCDFFINKHKTTVKLSSISTVNFQQGILEHIFNTYRLQVDINSSATANKTDFNLVFSRDVAENLKKKLTQDFFQEEGVTENAQIERDEEVTPIFEFPTSCVMKHGFLSISIGGVLFSAMALAFTLISQFTDFFGTQDNNVKGSSIGTFIAVLLIVGPVIVQIISPFIRYQNFKIGKRGNQIIVSYGLITKRQYNMPLSKTNAVVIKQPFLARFFHLYYGELINVGMGDEEDNKEPIFCLLVNKQELDFILNEINTNFVITEIGEKSPKSAFIPISIPYLLCGIISVVIASLLGYWWIGVIVLAFLMLCAFASYKTKALSILYDRAVITTGIFVRRTIIVPFNKIQNIRTNSGPISRYFRISKGSANILSPLVNMSNKIGYFRKDRFDKLSEKMLEFDSETKLF